MAATPMIGGEIAMPPKSPLVNEVGNMSLTSDISPEISGGNGTIDPNLLAIQQMRALDSIGWNGGERHFEGPHDEFCMLCGSSMELFGCQTCDTCYHAGCMTPSLDPSDVPSFWFCPHCVDNERHIPPSYDESYFAPLPSSLPLQVNSLTAVSELSNNVPAASHTVLDTPVILGEPAGSSKRTQSPLRGQQPTPPTLEPPSPVKAPSIPQAQAQAETTKSAPHKKAGRPRISSPPRKKSKYSAFSKEVDKALSVLYAELETAAGYGRSEGHLETKVQALEQQLKMQEGQMVLLRRELEFAKKELRREREEAVVLKVDNVEIRAENERVGELVERKEKELKEWRRRLREMCGSEMNE